MCHPYMVMGKEVPEYEEALETRGKGTRPPKALDNLLTNQHES